jgi:tetratricopeptide (TPR) repeat protein
MSYSEDQLWDLLRQSHEMPYGAAQIALIGQVITHADAQHLTELAYDARLHAINAYIYGGEQVKSFVTFSWCLASFDRDPARHTRSRHTLMWHFKHMVSGLTKFPEVPLGRTYDVLDDMERRWREGGHSLHAVYSHRHLVARHVGDLDAAQNWFDQWCTAPRDALSDCLGCDPSSKASWLSTRNRDEEAVALAEPVLSGRATCSEQPQGILTGLLKPYLRTGRLELARDAHRRAYRHHRSHLADLGDIASHLEFCALTGNQARGLEILERHLGWLDRAPSPHAAMWFAAAGALVLRDLADDGLADTGLTVHRPAHGDRAAADVPLAALAEDLTTFALDTAARFDARNGSPYQSQLIRDTLAAQPLVDHLPLSPTAPPARPSLTSTMDGPQATAESRAAPAVLPTEGPNELLDLIERCHLDERLMDAFAAWREFPRRYDVAALTPAQRARYEDWGAFVRARENDLAGAERAWRSAADGYAEAGLEEDRQRALARLGTVLCETGRAEEGVALTERATEFLLAHAPADRHYDDLSRLASAYHTVGRPEDALAALDRAGDHTEVSRRRHARADYLDTRAGMLMALGRADEAVGNAVGAVELARAAGPGPWLARALMARGVCAQQTGDRETALAAYDEAIGLADDPEMVRRIRQMRAVLLAGSPRAAEAVDDLAEAVAAAVAAGEQEFAARVRQQLALAYLNAGRALDAAEVAEESVAWHAEHDDDNLNSVRHLLQAAYLELGQPDEAVGQLELIAQNCAAAGNRAGVGQMCEEIAVILDRLDRDAAAAARFSDAAQAFRDAGLPFDEARNRRRHMSSLHWAGDIPAAVQALATADACVAALPASPEQSWERAALDYDAAKVLRRDDRPDEAVARARAAAEGFRSVPARLQSAVSEGLLAELLLERAQPVDAERSARRALVEVPADAGRGEWLAGLLAAALEAQGRADEAAAVRAEHQLPDPGA